MEFAFDWIDANWFALLQTAGIVSGFVFTGISIRREGRTRRVQNLLTITEHHRSIWQQVFEDANLLRVLKRRANLRSRPVTLQERIFVNLIILHLTALLAAMRAKEIAKPAGLDTDLQEFFSLPIPASVWRDTLFLRDEPTRSYVEALLNDSKKVLRGRPLSQPPRLKSPRGKRSKKLLFRSTAQPLRGTASRRMWRRAFPIKVLRGRS